MASILQRTQIRYTFAPGIENAIEFLVSLYNSGLGYSAISTARSALSTVLILQNGRKFGEHPLVCRYVYERNISIKIGITKVLGDMGCECGADALKDICRGSIIANKGPNDQT